MKIAFYTTKPYDRIWFEPMAERYNMELLFLEAPCRPNTLNLAAGSRRLLVQICAHQPVDTHVEIPRAGIGAVGKAVYGK